MMSDYRNRIKDYRTVDAAQIRRNPANFRRHPDTQRAALRSILGDVGQVAPLLVLEDGDGYLLLDGEARWSEGGAWPVAVLDLTPDEAATVLAMLDKIGADAEIDPAALMALLDALPSEARETASVAWSDDELAALIGEPEIVPGAGGDEFDPTPAMDGPTRTALGDLWIIGGVHRLLVGDCTDAANVARLMGVERATLLGSDPPYGTGGWRRAEAGAGSSPVAVHVKEEWDEWPDTALKMISTVADRVACFAMNLEPAFATFQDFKTRRLRYWKKSDPRPGFGGRIVESVEPVLVASHDGSALNGKGENWFEASTPRLNRDKDGTEHPYQKPILLIEWLLKDLTENGDIVIDPFLGSGTTLIAAHRTGRRCYGMEISPRYADVILRRAEAEGLTVEYADA